VGKRKRKNNTPAFSTSSCSTREEVPSPTKPRPIPGLDAKGITPELLPRRLNFLLWLYLVGF
jgi:hypothetical protein